MGTEIGGSLFAPFFPRRSWLPGLGDRLLAAPPPPLLGEFFLGDLALAMAARSARMRDASACSRAC